MEGCFGVEAEKGLLKTNLYVRYWAGEGGGRDKWKGEVSILLTRQQALSPNQIPTRLSSQRMSECVWGKGSGWLSKSNRKASLPQVRLLFLEFMGDGLAEGAGSLSGCCEPSDEGAAFHQLFLGFRSLAGPGKDKGGGVAKPKMFSLARHLSWWNHSAVNRSCWPS